MSTDDFVQALNEARTTFPEAMQTLAEQHLPLVGLMVRRFPASGIPREELYQQGVIGLMKALHQFDPARGTAFSTYAAALILGELRSMHARRSPVHIPRRELDIRRRIRQTEANMTARLKRSPTVDELADTLCMEPAELMLHMEDISVASADTGSPGGSALLELLPDPEDMQKRIELRDILSQLPEKDLQLVMLRYRAGLTQAETGFRLGMSQMQVSRREKIIRTLLKRAMAE